MSKIKFRVWCKNKNEWEKDFSAIGQDGCLFQVKEFWKAISQDNHIIMQFTGLLDKNGKEIYEGDIIKYSGDTKIRIFDPIQEKIKSPYWSITYVIYEAPSFKEIMIKQENDFFGELPHKRPFNMYAIPICEIIGNVWENPKLLEG